jgi:hypothetical protein
MDMDWYCICNTVYCNFIGDNMDLIKIEIETVKNYEFEGYTYADQLTEAQCEALGIGIGADVLSTEIKVYGSFDAYASDDEGYIEEITEITLFFGDKHLDLTNEYFDEDYLQSQIEKEIDYSEVLQDRLEAEGDRQYDSWRDSLYE